MSEDRHYCPDVSPASGRPESITCGVCGRVWTYTERDWPPAPAVQR